MKIFISILAVTVVALALATSAFAQSSQDGYSDNKGQIQAQVDSGGPSGGGTTPVATSNDGGGTLPFTGLDVAILAAAGGVLTAAGLGMRRLTRAHGSA
jgi:hypothetical protein